MPVDIHLSQNEYRKEIRHQSCIQLDALMLARSFPQTEWCAPIVTRNSSVEEQQTKINARHIAASEIHRAQKWNAEFNRRYTDFGLF